MPANRSPRNNDIKELELSSEGIPIVNMASPMQDTVVSSTVTNFHFPSYIIENNIKSDAIEESPNINYMKLDTELKNSCKLKSTQHNQDCCSWIFDFSKAICQLTGSTNYQLFRCFLTIYAKNVTEDAFRWNSKLSKLIILKKHINNVLLYYHFHWYDYKERVGDHYFYLNKMSDIIIVKVNLELKFFQTKTASINKVSNLLLNALYIYLSNSEEHIFKVLLKSNLAIEQNNKICSIIFNKCFSNIIINKPQLTSISYVRYILALKLWKSTSDNAEEIKKINNLASTLIGSTLPSICFDTLYFFPEPPKVCVNKTMWYLQTTSFDLIATIESFLKFEENLHDSTTLNELNINEYNKNCCHLQINKGDSLTNINKDIKIHKQYCKKRRNKIKSGKIIFVDLTKEDDDKSVKKKFNKKQNLEWLKKIRKKKNILKYSKSIDGIEIADSTEKCINPINNAMLHSLLISDTEVTKSCNFDNVHSNRENCDNIKCNNSSIVSHSNGIFENSDITKDERNQSNEMNKISLMSSDLFDDYICDMSIDSNLLSNIESSHLTETKLLSSDFNINSTKELVPSLLDFNLNGIDLLSNDFSCSSINAIDPCLTRKFFKETCGPNEVNKPCNSSSEKDSLLMTFQDKNQFLAELSDFGLYEVEDKNSLALNEETMITSTDTSSNPFILELNPDITISDDYNFMSDGKEYPISLIDIKHWKKKILKTTDTSKNAKEKVVLSGELGDDIFEEFKLPEEKKKQYRRKRSAATLKIKEPPTQKIKVPELLILDIENEHFSYTNENSKLEENIDGILNEADNDKVITKFLTEKIDREKIPLKNQQLNEFMNISNLQNLVDYIKSDDNNKIITFFDSSSSTLKFSKSDNMKPSTSYSFVRLLHEKELLLRLYIENIEKIEKPTGISPEKLRLHSLQKDVSESFLSQIKTDFSEANLIIFFTNNLLSTFKWLGRKCPKFFIIKEMNVNIDYSNVTDYLIPKSPKDNNVIFEIIQAESHDISCQLLAEKLGWSNELKKYENTA